MTRPVAQAEIDIDAPIDLVWQVMLDLASYPLWNPFIVQVDTRPGPLRVGQPLLLHVRWSSGRRIVSPETLALLDPPAPVGATRHATLTYRYDGWPHALYLVRGARVQALEQAGGPTRYRTREEFTGLLSGLLPLGEVQDGFLRHARALRLRAEQLAHAPR